MRSDARAPKFSPLMVTFVPGLPSFGLIPVTTGGARGIFFRADEQNFTFPKKRNLRLLDAETSQSI